MKKITNDKIFALCLGDFARGLINGIITTYLLTFFIPTNSNTTLPQFFMKAALTMAIIRGIGTVIDAVTDPWVASLSDNSKAKSGRRISFMRWSAIPYGLFCLLIFFPPVAGSSVINAIWGTAEDIKPYTDPVFENNIPLTQTERLTMNSRPKQPKYARNKNILVIGGSGSGKTRFFVKPSLMQMHSSYVVTDPKGTVLIECGKLLQRGGYQIKVLNTINFKKSMKYNPFAYLRSEKDILKLVNTIIANTKGDGEKSGEDFWVKAEKLYYTALIGYIWYEAPDEEKNFTTLLEMINASEAREDDEDFQNPVDLMFERLEEKDPEHFAVKQYRKYKLAAGDVCSK